MIKKQAVIKTLSYDSNGIIFINFSLNLVQELHTTFGL